MTKKVFLGGTCNGSTWRNELISLIDIEYFNPVVENWTIQCQEEEIKQRKACDFCLYCVTPKMTGVYSIAEVIDDSNKRSNKTIFVLLTEDCDHSFTINQLRSLRMVAKMVEDNGGLVFFSLMDAAYYLNQFSRSNQ